MTAFLSKPEKSTTHELDMRTRLLSSAFLPHLHRQQTLISLFSSSSSYRRRSFHHRLVSVSTPRSRIILPVRSPSNGVPFSFFLHSASPFSCRRRFSAFADEGGGLLRRKAVKGRSFYVCENCGESFSQWWGKCDSCKKSGTLKKYSEKLVDERSGGGAGIRAGENLGKLVMAKPEAGVENAPRDSKSWLKQGPSAGPQRLSDVWRGASESQWRLPLLGAIGTEIARVLGGGLVPGSLILVGGDPGVGKSTLLLQVCQMLAEGCDFYEPAPVLYVSGEESEEQISIRADRLQIAARDLFLYSATDLEVILNAIHELRPRAVVIDSIQTVYLPEAAGSAGSIVQVRECAAALLRSAKRTQIPIFVIGHVTRSGDIAGPRVLEHIVDVVLYLEGENQLSHRILRAVKNRFGSTDEVGVFQMVENGLEAVENPSQFFLSQRTAVNAMASGATAMTLEGSRPLLVEIQALCSGSSHQGGKYIVNGLEPQRLQLILAVLSKLVGVKVSSQTLLISVVGGLQVREPGVDLAIAVAICSSYFDKNVPADMAFVGEIGLGGEIRPVRQLDKRLLEASKLGFRRCVIPRMAEKVLRSCQLDTVTLIPCSSIQEVVQNLILPIFAVSRTFDEQSPTSG